MDSVDHSGSRFKIIKSLLYDHNIHFWLYYLYNVYYIMIVEIWLISKSVESALIAQCVNNNVFAPDATV